MIKASGKIGDTPLLVIGLSAENVTRLMADEPIVFATGELGLDNIVVMLVGGRTEVDVEAALRQGLGQPPQD